MNTEKFRFFALGAALLFGIGLAVIYAVTGHWLQAITLLVTGLGLAYFAITFSWNDWSLTLYGSFAGFLMLLSFGAVLMESSSLKADVQKAQVELFTLFIKTDYSISGIRFDEQENRLIDQGIKTCSTQGYIDMSELVSELIKARWFGPITSMIDAIWTVAADEPEFKGCIFYYKELRKTKPAFFVQFERNNPWLLTQFNISNELKPPVRQ